ncbi:MAG: serine/threonine protein kinase, partial [Archangium sp.]|nr:serine/threonine protein kinase [Archangium sp.]
MLSGARFCPHCGVSMEAIGPGTVLNQWQVIAPLAEGGMGTVFRGEHTRLKRAVCIKCIQPSLAGEDSIIRRFEREATVLASIHHPNVVSVIDLGQLPSGGLFLVLELVEGQNLRQLMRENPEFTVTRAVDLVRQILTGLEEVHQHQIIHRDLKPANLLIRALRDGTELVQLADFGIARAVSERDMTDSGLTSTGMVLGTPGYMAPEQILGESADARADLYAVGVVLHELLSGRRLFDAESGLEVLHKHLSNVPPPPLSKEFGGLNEVVAKALAKQPADRFQTARAFREALLASQTAPPQRNEVITVPEYRPSPGVVAAVQRPEAAAPAVVPRAAVKTVPSAPTRQTSFGALVDAWKASSGKERAEHAAMIERRVAEFCGQGLPEPILEMLKVVAAKREPEVEVMIRASLLDRIGAVARVFSGRSELPMVLSFVGNEGRNRLILSLRSVSTPELAQSIARAVIGGPGGALVEALPGFTTSGVAAVV